MQAKARTSSTSRFKFTVPLLVGLTLCVAEVGIRLCTFGPQALVTPQRFDPAPLALTDLVETFPDRKLGWTLRRNLKAIYKGQPFSTNSQGFRDRERSVSPVPGSIRLAVLGRSYEMGTGVGDSETWPAQLEGKYGHGRAEVLNFGVEAYSWIQMEAVYHRFAKNYKAPCVLLPLFYEEVESSVLLQAAPLPDPGTLRFSLSSLADHFYLPRTVQQMFWWSFFRFGSLDWTLLPQSSMHPRSVQAPGEHLTTVIQRLVADIKKQGSKVYFLPMPRLMLTSERLYRTGRRLIEIYAASAPGMQVITKLEELHGRVSLNSLALPGDPHFNAEWNGKIAESVYETLKDEKACTL